MKNVARNIGLCLLLLVSFPSIANNITVEDVSLTGQNVPGHYCFVEFDLSWYNSWRTTSVPQNWDAAWVFVKFSVAGGPWQHASLHSSGHVAPSGCTIDVPSDSVGVFIYRDSEGNGTNFWSGIQIRWDYGEDGVADDASLEVRVFAIEMVYVPGGDFYIGDETSTYTFYEYPTQSNPYLVDGSLINFGMSAGNLYAAGAIGLYMIGTTIPSAYPTGHEAYYCMKYEISQEQWVDFLNTLTRDQQNARTETDVSGTTISSGFFVMSGSDNVGYRNGITCPSSGLGTTEPITFYCDLNENGIGNEAADGQNIACNFLSWMDVAAYSDWAGLRPMSETEFEKSCRGPNVPVPGEYAWGNTTGHTTTYTVTNAGAPNEGISDIGVNVGNSMNALTYVNFGGPSRCGVFAASSVNNTRVETGSGYYGIMELSGNLREMIVTLLQVSGSSYTGLHGDGSLTTAGYANTDYWPGINGNTDPNTANTAFSGTGVTGYAGASERGSYYAQVLSQQIVSNRINSGQTNIVDGRESGSGGRLVRSAP